jgi:hypothetical protein
VRGQGPAAAVVREPLRPLRRLSRPPRGARGSGGRAEPQVSLQDNSTDSGGYTGVNVAHCTECSAAAHLNASNLQQGRNMCTLSSYLLECCAVIV